MLYSLQIHSLLKMRQLKTLWTIGHSTRPLETFLQLLHENNIALLADVRSFPGSRKYPQYNRESLAQSLPEAGIAYKHYPGLGGRRKAHKDSVHTIWHNLSFRGFADYMDTPQFKESAAGLMQAAREQPTCIMCSEAVWWRCHRSMIADYFKSKSWKVLHILSAGSVTEHPYSSAARIVGGKLTYGRDENLLF